MLSRIKEILSCNVQHESVLDQLQLRSEIAQKLQPIRLDVTICDRPTHNQNGLTQYNYDENHQSIRQRRVDTARKFDLTLSDAPFDNRFVFELAARVRATHGQPGQCAEMASLSAVEICEIAPKYGFSTYTIQLPDYNHTITLVSTNDYRSGDKVDWRNEFKLGSTVVDLWQGALEPENLDALVSSAKKNFYTENSPRAIVQCKVTNEWVSW
ncbi:hypothetical protein [Providencia rettgeri]|uniref:hypothetical protein n=1 Tax=Providencia rettgeri TaxID=587 RepID=UPI0034E0B908